MIIIKIIILLLDLLPTIHLDFLPEAVDGDNKATLICIFTIENGNQNINLYMVGQITKRPPSSQFVKVNKRHFGTINNSMKRM